MCIRDRALGIPAKLVDGVPQVWRRDGFSPLWGQEPTAALTVTAPAGQEALEAQNYTLSRREAGGYLPLTTGAVPAGESRQLLLPPGAYRLWTVNRLPGGGLLARWEDFSLSLIHIYQFNPVDFDPKQWARAAKEAGMKYVVLTAKHHDGFCLFDSQYTDFKSTNTPYGRDIVKEFVEAVRAEGLKVGLYFTCLLYTSRCV